MPNINMHDRIIDNLEQYSPQQLSDYIRLGVISFEELQNEGLDKTIQAEIKVILQRNPEEDDWKVICGLNTKEAYTEYLGKYPQGVHCSEARDKINALVQVEMITDDEQIYSELDKDSISDLEDFIRRYPTSKFRSDARQRINKLRRNDNLSGVERIQRIIQRFDPEDVPNKIESLIQDQKATEDDVYEIFRKDHNVLPVEVVEMLDGVIDYSKLSDLADIDIKFINKLEDDTNSQYELDTDVSPLSSIPDGFTEIYFWGVPASGKTCAVGSIMSAMTNGNGVKSVMPYTESQGSKYMMPLASSFRKDEVCVLPPRTKVEETFEMRYLITDDNNKEHKLAFIDLSGELFECMHLSRANVPLSPKQSQALQILEDILVNNRSKNPKIHFFVIEYGSEDNRYVGLSQNELLLSCLNYLDDKSILKDNTIGAYLIITKADKAVDQNIGNYIDENYEGFFNGLLQRMNKWGINTRKGESLVKRFPFSIGDVCFQKWCLYDPEWTQYIIEEIKNRSYGIGTGFFGKIKEMGRK